MVLILLMIICIQDIGLQLFRLIFENLLPSVWLRNTEQWFLPVHGHNSPWRCLFFFSFSIKQNSIEKTSFQNSVVFFLYFKMNSISSNTISEQCTLIQQQNSFITNEQLDIFFSAIDDEFTKNKELIANLITEVVRFLQNSNK